MGEPLDEVTAKWLLEISDALHAKIAATGLCSPRRDKTLGGFLDGYLAELRKQAFFNEMKYRKLIYENPFERLTVPKVDDHARKIYVSEEYALKAMEHAPTWEWKLIIALWRFGGLRRNEPLLIKWSDILWDKRLIRVRSNKKKDERFVPIFPEIAQPLAECYARATEGVAWVIDRACPQQYRSGERACGMRSANLVTVFDDIVTKAGLSVIPMVGNNMRASAVKDLYSGKYPELRGRIDLIGKIFGHSPQVAMTYYKRFQMDDFKELTETFGTETIGKKQCRENGEHRETTENTGRDGCPGSAESGEATEIMDATGTMKKIRA